MGHVRHPTYPLIIKHGNWKSSLNGGGSGKIICKCLITGGFLLTGFVFCVFSTPAFYQRCNPFPSITHSRTHAHTHSLIRSLTHSLTPPSFPPLFLPCASSSPLWAPTDLDHSKSQLKRRKLATSSIAHPQHARARTPWQAPAQQHARARTLSRAPAHERISQKMPDRMS